MNARTSRVRQLLLHTDAHRRGDCSVAEAVEASAELASAVRALPREVGQQTVESILAGPVLRIGLADAPYRATVAKTGSNGMGAV